MMSLAPSSHNRATPGENGGMGEPAIDVDRLSPEERLVLLERLWDSLSDQDLPLTARQREELNRRLDDLDREGRRGIPWDEVLQRVEDETA